MTTRPGRIDESGLQARPLLEQRVSRRALLTLSLARGAAAAAGYAPRPASVIKAAPATQQLRSAPCGACGRHHGPGVVCAVEARQQALARGFARAPIFTTNEPEGGS